MTARGTSLDGPTMIDGEVKAPADEAYRARAISEKRGNRAVGAAQPTASESDWDVTRHETGIGD